MIRNWAHVLFHPRPSAVSETGMILTLSLGLGAFIAAASTGLRFEMLPNLMPIIAGVFTLDILSGMVEQTPLVKTIQVLLYGVFYLVITSFCGVLASYASQRFAFPLQDHVFASADRALGINWFDLVHWVDDRPAVHVILKLAYLTMSAQIVLPVLILAFAGRTTDLRRYLLAFTIALAVTITVATFVPAASPIALLDQSTFRVLRFTGATPVDHLMRLRASDPVTIAGGLGGIISFPSFHATVAILTPLTLWRYRNLFCALLVWNALMLASTITEGAHYVVDIPAGSAVAVVAFLLSRGLATENDAAFGPFRTSGNVHAWAAAGRQADIEDSNGTAS